MYTKEQKTLRFSMMLLFLALLIVYIVRYQVKGNELKKMIQSETSGSGIQIVSKIGDLIPIESGNTETGNMIYTGNELGTGNTKTDGDIFVPITGEQSITSPTITKEKITTTNLQTTTGTTTKTTNMKLLSGTSIYYGSIAIIEKLGIKYQYALVDATGTRYIYLGTPSYDFASIARALKGSLYTLATEQDLLQNKLFGNKVVFINLPEYKDKQVLMLIYLNDGIWLIQMEYSLYHKSKSYLKSLFIDL